MLVMLSENPGTTGLILRRTYPELYKSHIVKLFEEFPATQSWWRQESKELRIPKGGRCFFGSAEHAGDMAAFYSAEFDYILVDEAQEFSQGELEQLSGSNRSTKTGIKPFTLYTFMPGVSETGLPPKGLEYLKRVFVNKTIRGPEERHKWEFIQAFAWDNVEWARQSLAEIGANEEEFYSWPEEKRRNWFIDRTDFGATLSAITSESLRQAWLHGQWTTFVGQYFDIWDYERFTREEPQISRYARYWVSGDWGDDHPYAFYLHSLDTDGVVRTIDEIWGRHTDEVEMGRAISRMCGRREIEAFPFSWEAFGRLSRRTRRPITQLIAEGLSENIPPPYPADASPGSRVSGWRFMRHLLETDRWIISRKCEKLIECLPTLMRDMERNTEDVRKTDWSENQIGDDPADASRYGLQYMQSEIPQEPPVPPPQQSGQYESFVLKKQIFGKPENENEPVVISSLPPKHRNYHRPGA